MSKYFTNCLYTSQGEYVCKSGRDDSYGKSIIEQFNNPTVDCSKITPKDVREVCNTCFKNNTIQSDDCKRKVMDTYVVKGACTIDNKKFCPAFGCVPGQKSCGTVKQCPTNHNQIITWTNTGISKPEFTLDNLRDKGTNKDWLRTLFNCPAPK